MAREDTPVAAITSLAMLEEVRKVLDRLHHDGPATVNYWLTTMKHAHELRARAGGVRMKSGIPNENGHGYLVQVEGNFVTQPRDDEISESGDVIRRGSHGYKCPAILLIIDGTTGMAMSFRGLKDPMDLSSEGAPTVVQIQ